MQYQHSFLNYYVISVFPLILRNRVDLQEALKLNMPPMLEQQHLSEMKKHLNDSFEVLKAQTTLHLICCIVPINFNLCLVLDEGAQQRQSEAEVRRRRQQR